MSRVTDEAKERIITELVESKDALFRKQFTENILSGGVFPTGQNKPQQRLIQYMGRTLPEDLQFVLSEDYWESRREGTGQPLLAEILWQQFQQQAQEAAKMKEQAMLMEMQGMPPPELPPGPEEPGPWRMWPLLSVGGLYQGQKFNPVPMFVVKDIAADFRRLYNAEVRKQEEALV